MIHKVRLFWRGLLLSAFALAVLAGGASANHSAQALISTGPTGGNSSTNPAFYDAASADGTRVFFDTDEQLVSADMDSSFDVYERFGATTTLVSIGPSGGNGSNDTFFDGISKDGTHVYFETDEKLVSTDHDNQFDIYERTGTTTNLVSTGPNGGNGNFDAFFGGASDDGSRVFFETDESLITGETDGTTDVYQRSGGATTLISTGPTDADAGFFAAFVGASADGTHVFFETSEALVSTDTDACAGTPAPGCQDVYERTGSTTNLVSAGGNGAFNASWDGNSQNGSLVFFHTAEPLVTPDDADSQIDVYQRSGSTTTLLSTGSIGGNGAFGADFVGSSADGSHVFLQTSEKLESTDTDNSRDVYDRSGGSTTEVSLGETACQPVCGNGIPNVTFDGASADGSQVFFDSAEALTTNDLDGGKLDVFERSGGNTTRLSTGPTEPPGVANSFNAFFGGSSTDGARVFFETVEKLTSADMDNSSDVYERFNGATTLISIGPTGGNGTPSALFDGNSDNGIHVFFDTRESLVAADMDGALDIYSSSVSINYDKPVGASPLRVSLAPAFQPCETGAANSQHGQPLNFPSCNAPQPISSTVRIGPNGLGFVRMVVCPVGTMSTFCNAPGAAMPLPDVRLTGSIRDVKCAPTLPGGQSACSGPGADYNPNGTGPYTSAGDGAGTAASPGCFPSGTSDTTCVAGTDLTATAELPGATVGGTGKFQGRGVRITDQLNGFGQNESATMVDIGFPIPMDCIPTASTTQGSTCGVNTTANALVPGVVKNGKGAIWRLGQIEVKDSGPDGVRGNSDDQVFEVQGVFLP